MAAVEMVVMAVEEMDRVTDPAMVPVVEAVSVTGPDLKDREYGTTRTKMRLHWCS